MVELDKEPTLARSIEIDETSITMDNSFSDDVYANVDEIKKKADLNRSKEKEKMPTTMKVSSSKTTKARLILGALIFLFIMFLFLIVITSLLLKYYLAMSEEMSYQKNHADDQQRMVLENVKSTVKNYLADDQQRMILEDIKSTVKNYLENVKQNFLQDIKAINKTLDIVSGWKPIGLYSYYFSTEELSWNNAKDECVRKGSALASLKNKEETDALKALLENGKYWIGLRRDTEPEKWKWLDGSALSHSTWKLGEPNNLPNENCAESVYGYWNDRNCESKVKFICKKFRI